MIFEQLGEPEPFPGFLPVPANVRAGAPAAAARGEREALPPCAI